MTKTRPQKATKNFDKKKQRKSPPKNARKKTIQIDKKMTNKSGEYRKVTRKDEKPKKGDKKTIKRGKRG